METSEANSLAHAGQGYIKSINDLIRIVGVHQASLKNLYRGQNTDKPLLPRFARMARDLDLPDPLDVESRMLESFRRQAVPFLPQPFPQSEWDWLALAQHHGLPTRLLDWTANPLAGLWFAVADSVPKDAVNGVFWILRLEPSDLTRPLSETSLFNLRRTYIFQPSHITQRIAAQRGWFTVHKYLEEKNKFIPLDYNKNFARKLQRYIMPLDCFASIREELGRLGIDRFSLFPELTALAQNLQDEYLRA